MMKRRLWQTLSLLCALALAFACVTTAAPAEEQTEARIITVEWEDGSSPGDSRPGIPVTCNSGFSTVLSAENNWCAEVSVTAGTAVDWSFITPEGYSIRKNRINDTVVVLTVRKTGVSTLPPVSASVRWDDRDNAKGIRPESVQLALMANGSAYGEPKPVKAPGWKATWENLPANDDSGKSITYTVSQLQTPSGYTPEVSGLTVRNTLQTGRLTLNAAVSGVPEGADISRLSLTVTGPDPSMPVTLAYSQLSGGSYVFDDVLPGAYLVRGTNADSLVEGYIMDAENSRVSDAVYLRAGETAALNFRYTWKLPENYEAEEDYDPTANNGNLTFEILGPDSRMPMTVNYARFTGGKYELPDLAPGVYTVVERNAETLVKYYTLTSASVTGMTLTVGANGTSHAKLFNQYEPAPTPEPDAEFVDIPVTKSWNDNNNADGNRPGSVVVRLYADGVEVDSHVLTANEGWRFTFTEKPRYREDNKTEIVYTVGEDAVPMYAAMVNGYNIVNDYMPEVTSVSVSKVWRDNNNKQKLRPASIAMTLSDGQKEVRVVLLSKENGWAATVSNLPTVVNGKKAEYSWKEQAVPGYELEGVEQKGSHMTFTNAVWERPENPAQGRKPKTPGSAVYVFEEYDTPLGVEIVINHVGDCFD